MSGEVQNQVNSTVPRLSFLVFGSCSFFEDQRIRLGFCYLRLWKAARIHAEQTFKHPSQEPECSLGLRALETPCLPCL